MLNWLIQKIGGDTSAKRMKALQPIVRQINALEPEIEKKSDTELRELAEKHRKIVRDGTPLEKVLPEAFALVRETAKRTIGLRHFDVQLLGGMILHDGRIAEMKTGEGKTLVATLPAYLNGLTGKGVHIVTVNDYLARRDRQWMGPIFERLGLTVGLIQHDESSETRRVAYSADITYGTNNEFGFDYLRDNMATSPQNCVQKGLHFCIVDEVDSILIDEARTPLIISGMVEQDLQGYFRANEIVLRLTPEADFKAEGKTKNVTLTDAGIKKIEEMLGIESLYDLTHMEFAHQIIQALRAHHMYKRDVDYIAKEGEIIIVDEFTGRLMLGRRYSDGLHQAIEAKERVQIQQESQTLATITFQNYFRLYNKLAGMTGTAKTQEEEFWKVYKLEVAVIPTHKKMIRQDLSDVVYKSKKMKFEAAADEIEVHHKEGRPVLVGTVSIENSELLAEILRHRRIAHHVLNAKHHEREAEIIAGAGQKGAVTISTNMAGRGTDIVLGEGVAVMGGLHVLGTERHENRRIDNQLRGRSGRQGDPGTTRFFVSLADDLMKHFGSGRIAGLMDRLGIPEDTPIEHRMVTRAIENAQSKVERYYTTVRKQVLEFDDVMNRQRETIYQLRRRVLFGEGVEEKFLEMMETLAGEVQGDAKEMRADYEKKKTELGEIANEVLRQILLRTIDTKWIDQLHTMDSLREGIGLRAWGQRDPLVEYKMEAYNAFNAMMRSVREDAFDLMMKVQVAVEQPIPMLRAPRAPAWVESRRDQPPEPAAAGAVPVLHKQKIGRNDPCHCGSGKKYKKCHGRGA